MRSKKAKSLKKMKTDMKKAQVQIGETVGVIMFFTLIMILTLVFIVKQNASSREKERVQRVNEMLTTLARTIQTMNELRCSKLSTETLGCLDLEKIKAFYDELKNNQFALAYYKNLFGFSRINVNIVYAYDPIQENNYTIYNNTGDLTDSLYFAMPIQVYDPVAHKNMLGMLEIEYYIQR